MRAEKKWRGVELQPGNFMQCAPLVRDCSVRSWVPFPAQIFFCLSDLNSRTAFDELLFQWLSVVCSSNSNATSHKDVREHGVVCYLSKQSPSIALPDCPFQLAQQTWI